MSEETPSYRVDAAGSCPFCRVDRGRVAWSSALAIALWDVYPVSLGHALVDQCADGVGYNDGEPAGQTIMHFHVHVIPRYQGDVSDPRGGVRWLLPDKAAYWLSTEQ